MITYETLVAYAFIIMKASLKITKVVKLTYEITERNMEEDHENSRGVSPKPL